MTLKGKYALLCFFLSHKSTPFVVFLAVMRHLQTQIYKKRNFTEERENNMIVFALVLNK
jgi:hypothetical protein